MNNLLETSLFAGVSISLVSYMIGLALKKKFKLGIFNPLLISIIFTGARIPLAILLCRTALGLNGIWCAVSSTSIVKGIIFVATFFWITRSSRILKDNSRL